MNFFASRWIVGLVWSMVSFSVVLSLNGCIAKTKVDRRKGYSSEQIKKSEAEKSKNRESPLGDTTPASVEITPFKSGPDELAKGRDLYLSLCVQCHPTLGQGEIKKFQNPCMTCDQFESFVTKVMTTMPLGRVGQCDSECARTIGFYLFSPL